MNKETRIVAWCIPNFTLSNRTDSCHLTKLI